MFILPSWPASPKIKAYMTLRKGGQSPSPYNDFNLGFKVGDTEENVHANRQKLKTLLNLPAEPIWLEQTHSNLVLEATPENRHKNADSAYTRQSKEVCAILTADCLPILLCDEDSTAVGAIHAGWRGLANGIIPNTLKALNIPGKNLLAWLGPAIGPQKFEVGHEVYSLFIEKNAANKKAFSAHTESTWLADIYELARIQLRLLKIEAIYGGDHCTFSQTADFFSYRRDQGKTGRMASLIWLDE